MGLLAGMITELDDGYDSGGKSMPDQARAPNCLNDRAWRNEAVEGITPRRRRGWFCCQAVLLAGRISSERECNTVSNGVCASSISTGRYGSYSGSCGRKEACNLSPKKLSPLFSKSLRCHV